MRHLAILLLAVTAALAMPLRKGASLGYHVWRGWSGDSTLATLTVRDSVVTDSGVVWTLSVRDSLLTPTRDQFPLGGRVRTDSATILVKGKDTAWIHPSCLAAIDVTPYRGGTIPVARGRTMYPPGSVPCGCNWDATYGPGSHSQSYSTDGYSADSTGRRDGFWGRSVAGGMPSVMWLSDAGVASVHDGISNEEWKLRYMDGRFATHAPWDSASGMVVVFRRGESWVWSIDEAVDDETNRFNPVYSSRQVRLTWQVADSSADSSGWLRRLVRFSSEGSESTESTFQLRMDKATGNVVTTAAWDGHALLASGFWKGWSDSFESTGVWLRSRWISTQNQTLESGFDSIGCELQNGLGTRRLAYSRTYKSGSMSKYARSLRAALLKHDGAIVIVGVATRARASSYALRSISDLDRELSARPGATVRLAFVSGRSEIHSGLEALRVLCTRHGVVFVELRDGEASMRGRLLLP